VKKDMPNIIRQKRKANYTVIPNEMLNNTELSFKAKAILCYLLSKPDKWSVYLSQLAKASTDGYESVVSGMNELIAKKYVFRQPNSGVNPGGWEYFVYDEPQVQEDSRLSEKPTRDFADSGKPLTNKDRLSKVKKDIKENLLTSYEEEEESSAVASHSSVELNQPNLFPTNPSEANASGSANAKLKSADGKETTPHCAAPPRNKKSPATQIEKPAGVSEQVWNDFIALRKAKRAPLSATALSVIAKEAEKAAMHIEEALTECVTRGWQSFKAEWIKPKTTTKPERFSNF
jgi:hypothetical protein